MCSLGFSTCALWCYFCAVLVACHLLTTCGPSCFAGAAICYVSRSPLALFLLSPSSSLQLCCERSHALARQHRAEKRKEGIQETTLAKRRMAVNAPPKNVASEKRDAAVDDQRVQWRRMDQHTRASRVDPDTNMSIDDKPNSLLVEDKLETLMQDADVLKLVPCVLLFNDIFEMFPTTQKDS